MYYHWKPYVPVAARRLKADRTRAKLEKSGKNLSPVTAGRGAIAKTFWGKAWCTNLERYSDYANRLPRGRSYLRNGSVLDLKIAAGSVAAQVLGSRLYRVRVSIPAVAPAHWQGIARDCARSIDSWVELLQGQLSASVMERISRPDTGLFPTPRDIAFACSCPDSAAMCKHVAATLYGVGARLDMEPELLFTLRGVDAKELIAQAAEAGPAPHKAPGGGRILDSSKLADVFGIDLAIPGHQPATAKRQLAAKKAAKKKATAAKKKNPPSGKRKPPTRRGTRPTSRG